MISFFPLLIPVIVINPDEHWITKYKGGRELFRQAEKHQIIKKKNGVEVWGKGKLGLQEKE